ncbi:MAG: hypothetical protein JNK60_03855 [Acidobacteria bacterium]|nr:hypothetical protein [Acidobacteriota bacterium]
MESPSRSAFLFGRATDLALFGGSALLAMGLLAAGRLTGDLNGDAPLWVWMLGVLGVDVAHVWSTAYRVAASPAELSRRKTLYVSVLALSWVGGVLLYAGSPLLFWRVLAYLAVFHFVRQQYGWVSLARKRNLEGEAGRLLDTLTIYAATLAPLVFWHASPGRRFHWFLAGDFVIALPKAAGPLAMAILAGLLTAYGVKEALRARRGLPLSFTKSLVVVTTALTWTLGIVVFNSDYAFTVTNVFVHGIPYLGLVYLTSRKSAEKRLEQGEPPAPGDRLVTSAGLFLLPLLAIAFLEEWGWDRLLWHENGVLFPGPDLTPSATLLALVVPLLAVPQAAHYLLDGLLWKVVPENRETVDALGLPT